MKKITSPLEFDEVKVTPLPPSPNMRGKKASDAEFDGTGHPVVCSTDGCSHTDIGSDTNTFSDGHCWC